MRRESAATGQLSGMVACALALLLALPEPLGVLRAVPCAGGALVAVLDDEGRIRLGRPTAAGVELAGLLDGPYDSLAEAPGPATEPAVAAVRGRTVVLWRGPLRAVRELPGPVRQLLPLAEPPGWVAAWSEPGGAAVGWLPVAGSVRRFAALPAEWRTWRLGWARAGDRRRLAACTYKPTRWLPFAHNCLAVFAWEAEEIRAWWLGSRLSRPYVDAVHADLRGDGLDRLVAIEVTATGEHVIMIYRPLGFGYEGEWESPPLAGLQRLRTLRGGVLVGGRLDGAAWLRELRAGGAGYELVNLAPIPALDDVAEIGAELIGWWDGSWRRVARAPLARGDER